MLVRDVEHAYRSLAGSEGRCRLRIYAPTAAAGGLPIVLLGELASNTGHLSPMRSSRSPSRS